MRYVIALLVLCALIALGCEDSYLQNEQKVRVSTSKNEHGQDVVLVVVPVNAVQGQKEPLAKLDRAIDDLGPGEEVRIHLAVPDNKKVHLTADVTVEKGTLTIDTQDGAFTYLLAKTLKITTTTKETDAEERQFQGRSHLFITVHPEECEVISEGIRRNVRAILHVTNTRNPQNATTSGSVFQRLPFMKNEDGVVVTVGLKASEDFKGAVMHWALPVYK